MIPAERDDTMLVTMTKGDLAELVVKIANEAAEKAVNTLICHLAADSKTDEDSDTLVGGAAIAKAIGVDRSTFYNYRRDGRLGNAVHQIGGRKGKLVAIRSELMKAIANN